MSGFRVGRRAAFTVAALVLVPLLSCHEHAVLSPDASPKNSAAIPGDPELFAKAAIERILMLSRGVAESYLCERCRDKIDPLSSSLIERKVVGQYEKHGIDFKNRAAHDFSGIGCRLDRKAGNRARVLCRGDWVIRDSRGDVFERISIDTFLDVLMSGDELKYCARSCPQQIERN